MCKSDRKVRQFNSAQTAEFVIFSLTWRAAHRAGWFDDWSWNRKETASSRSEGSWNRKERSEGSWNRKERSDRAGGGGLEPKERREFR